MTSACASLVAVAALAATFMAPAAAQQRPDPPAPAPAARTGDEVTLRGCLMVQDAAPGTRPGTGPVVQLRSSEGTPETYLLVKAPRADVDLAAHAGKLVEVRGVEYHEGGEGPREQPRAQGGQMQDVGQAAAADPPSRGRDVKGQTAADLTTLQVSRIRVLAATCSAP